MIIRIKIDNIDYASVLKVLAPLISKVNTSADDNKAGKLIGMLGKGGISSGMLSLIPQETKDNMLITLVNGQKESILKLIRGLLKKHGIGVDVEDIELSED